jgi:hypothetical protein
MLAFYPNLTPRQVIEEGAFGGCYFGSTIEDPIEYDYETLFKYHFEGLDKELYLGDKYKPKSNKWKVRSGKDYRYWKDMGWMHKEDPYGWFEWWCKYDMGRRSEDDKRQIARWQDFCGTKGRWRNNIYSQLEKSARYSDREDWNISPRIQQSLRHWGYEINNYDYLEWSMNKEKAMYYPSGSNY